MHCEPEFLQAMRKGARQTEFACFIRNVTPAAVKLIVPFGQMEARPRMTEEEVQRLRYQNACRYCAGTPEKPATMRGVPEATPDDMGDPVVL
jgi:hypothetical protein